MALLKKFGLKDGYCPGSFDYPRNKDNISLSGETVGYTRESNIKLWSDGEGVVYGMKEYKLDEPRVVATDIDYCRQRFQSYALSHGGSFEGSDAITSIYPSSNDTLQRYRDYNINGYECYFNPEYENIIPQIEAQLPSMALSFFDSNPSEDIIATGFSCLFWSSKPYIGHLVWYVTREAVDDVRRIGFVIDANDTSIDNYLYVDGVGFGSLTRLAYAAMASNVRMSEWVGSDGGKLYFKKATKKTMDSVYSGMTHSTINGRRYAYDENFCMSGNTSITKAVLGKGVKEIYDFAFADCTSLSALTIPDGVTHIGQESFRNLSSLETLIIPASVTSVDGLLFGNTKNASGVKHVVIEGDSVFPEFFCNYISSNNQEGYYGVESVSFPNAKSIGNRAFMNCSKLSSVTIPDVCASIGIGSFMNCSGITSIVIPSSVKDIPANAFRDCRSLSSVTLSEGLETLGNIAFYRCTSLTSIEIPSSVSMIDGSAFANCISLSSVTLHEGITAINTYTFSSCESLTSIEIPSSVTMIGEEAFSYCTNLSSIVLHDGLQTIGSTAFSLCSSLSSITIPDSVTYIETSAFYDCDNLTAIYYNGPATGFPWDAYNAVLNPS